MSELLIICEERNEEFILERVVINGDKRKNGVGKIEGNETKRGENASRREDNNEINTQKKKVYRLRLLLFLILLDTFFVPGLGQDAIPHDRTTGHVQHLLIHRDEGKINRTSRNPKRPTSLQRRQRISLHFMRPVVYRKRIRKHLRPGEEAHDDHRPEHRLVQEYFCRKRREVGCRHRTWDSRPFLPQKYVPDVL